MKVEAPDIAPLVLTANTRLARALRREYDLQQVALGTAVWEPPNILPFGAWLERCWREWLYAAPGANPILLLRPAQEQAIWEEVVGKSAEAADLLQVAATAKAALEAWNLLHAWQLPLDASEWNDTRDSEAFRNWATEFQKRCEKRRWLSTALLPDFIAARLQTGELDVPARVTLCGFAEFTPAQQQLLDVLRGGTCQVEIRQGRVQNEQDTAVRMAFADSEDEIRAAAQWARQCIEGESRVADGEPRIGIVVPEISRFRSAIERALAEEFHPSGRLVPERDAQRAFNISLGPPLAEYPLIQIALVLMQTNPDAIPLEDASRIVRSPFIAGAEAEYTRRGLLDASLRQLREPEVEAATIGKLAASGTKAYAAPLLAACLSQWERSCREPAPRLVPSDWAAVFSNRLSAIGWPGNRVLSSAEHQTTAAWNELLSEFAGLDGVVGLVSASYALTLLQRLAASRQFQPESEPAPVQVLGILEASGLEFDRLWILGMHDGEWPPAANANPFLPLRLQRARNLPHSSPQRELDFTRLLTRQLLASSPDTVISYPKREGDSDLRIGPVFAEIPESPRDALGLKANASHAELLRQSSSLETLNDHRAPPWDGALYRGGTAIFQDQAACPFRAFARARLGAEPLGTAESGLSAMDRGNLLHDILQRVWNTLRSHSTLMTADPDHVTGVARDAIAAALARMAAKKKALRQPRFAAIEQRRLEKLVAEWLELEKQRLPFVVMEQEETRRVTVGGIELTIRADRIDRLQDGTHIVLDYKTSNHGPAEWKGPRPDEPQLPLYAVTANAPLSDIHFGIAKLGETRLRGVDPKDGPLAEQILNWKAVLEELAADFRSGKAGVDPKDPRKSCRYCGLQTVCRIREARAFDDESELEPADD